MKTGEPDFQEPSLRPKKVACAAAGIRRVKNTQNPRRARHSLLFPDSPMQSPVRIPRKHRRRPLLQPLREITQARLRCLRGPSANCFTPPFTIPGLLPNTARTFRIRRQHPPGRSRSTCRLLPTAKPSAHSARGGTASRANLERDLVRFTCAMFVRHFGPLRLSAAKYEYTFRSA